jgi:hypothetical protein
MKKRIVEVVEIVYDDMGRIAKQVRVVTEEEVSEATTQTPETPNA